MQLAHDVVERWIAIAKNDVVGGSSSSTLLGGTTATLFFQESDEHIRNKSNSRGPVDDDFFEASNAAITLELWQQVVYGWSVLAPKHPVAVVRMKEVVDRVVQEARIATKTRKSSVDGAAALSPPSSSSSSLQQQRRRRSLPPPNAPTVDLFNTYLYGLSQAALSSRSAALQARQVLRDMEEYYGGEEDNLGWWCRPNNKSYMNVLVAFRNSRHPGSAGAVMEVLDDMMRAHDRQRQEYEAQYGVPYHDDVNAVVGGDGDSDGDPRGKSNRRKLVTPDQATFTVALQAIVQSMGNTRQPLREMLSAFLKGSADAVSDVGRRRRRFDDKFWVSVIHAHARLVDQERSAAERVKIAREAELVLLDEVVTAVNDDWREAPHTDIVLAAWNACLDTWSRARAKEAPLECERILQTMLTGAGGAPAPDTASFNSCHYAWSRFAEAPGGGASSAAQRSNELLQLQKDLGDPARQPDFQTYALVILAFGSAGRIPEARELLEDMVSYVRELPSPPARNPAAPFSALLTSIAKQRPEVSGWDTGARGGDAAPDAWVADVSDAGQDLYAMALQTYVEATKDLYGIGASADHHTFSAMLRCIAAHSSGAVEREARVKEVFDAACDSGNVSRSVVEGLTSALGEAKARALLRDMPRFWSRNVPIGDRGHSARPRGKRVRSSQKDEPAK
jgi:hypothetical protein